MSTSCHHQRRVLAAALVVAVSFVLAPMAHAKPKPKPPTAPSGYDVSYPQCNHSLPTAAFGIVGVNDGIVFSANPCLGTGDGPSELAWAQSATNHSPTFYANTADPGPAYSSHWPTGQTTPQPCDAAAPNSTACSYDYGWNAARDSFAVAVAAEQSVNQLDISTATSAAAQAPWWLDIETSNSWQTLESAYGPTSTSKANDVAALDGALAALRSDGVSQIGLYSTGYQWTQIAGNTGTHFASQPDWVAGFSSSSTAQAACGTTGFAGGPVRLTQYPAGGFDADISCP